MSSAVILTKMSAIHESPIQYRLYKNADFLLNDAIGAPISIHHTRNKYCLDCGQKIYKTFFNGFCFPCFKSSPHASECIIKPELCRAHLGEGRNVQWEIQNHNQPHIVYLSVSSGLKVGITRQTMAINRWIDQGASSAIVFAEVPHRYAAGCIEMSLKSHVSDKTAWQRMLKNEVPSIDLVAEKQRLSHLMDKEFHPFISNKNTVYQLQYPVINYPIKVTSLKLDKQPLVHGVLVGIKGQYLIFDDNRVLNIRSHGGYEVAFKRH